MFILCSLAPADSAELVKLLAPLQIAFCPFSNHPTKFEARRIDFGTRWSNVEARLTNFGPFLEILVLVEHIFCLFILTGTVADGKQNVKHLEQVLSRQLRM